MQCPKCSSTNYRTNGKTPKGTIRYFCKDCRKSWSDRAIGRPPRELVAMTNAERQTLYRQKKAQEENSIANYLQAQ